jgi:hypothetical protein
MKGILLTSVAALSILLSSSAFAADDENLISSRDCGGITVGLHKLAILEYELRLGLSLPDHDETWKSPMIFNPGTTGNFDLKFNNDKATLNGKRCKKILPAGGN